MRELNSHSRELPSRKVWSFIAAMGLVTAPWLRSELAAQTGSDEPQPLKIVKDTDDLVFEKVPLNQVKPTAGFRGVSRTPSTLDVVPLFPQETVPPFAPSNVNVSNLVGNESEVSIAINPTNPQNMVIVGHSPGAVAMNTFFTLNGGQNWTLVALGAAQDGLPNCNRTDPTVAFDANGVVYAGYFTFLCPTGTRTLIVARSNDGGQTYPQLTAAVVDPTNQLDKEILGTGPDPLVPGQQNVYVAYRLDVGAAPDVQIHVTASYDGGVTFVNDQIINDDSAGAGNDFSSFGMPAVGPNGELYVVWDDFSNNPAFSQIMFDVSFDAGVNWGTDVQIATTPVTRNNANGLPASGRYTILAQPDRGILAVPSIAVDRTGGPNNGRIYVTYTTVGGGGVFDTDVVLRFSDDDGANWSAPVTVNDDGGTNSQFHPWVSVDNCAGSLGRVAVTWYDARNDAANGMVQNFHGVSEDGGATFQPNVQVSSGQSDQSTNNPLRFGNNYLEYIGVDTCENVACSVWADNSTNADDLDFFSDCVPLVAADLTVTKSDSPDPVTTGDNLIYTIEVTNDGPDASSEASITDTLPSSLTFVSASAGCLEAAGTVTCSLGDLNDGETALVTIEAAVSCLLVDGTLISNTATVSSPTNDPDASNNSADASTVASNPPPVITPVPDIEDVECTSPEGAPVNYTLPTATDNCDPPPTVICAPPSGSTFPLGTSTVTCTATDNVGAASTTEFDITVVDTTPPTIASLTASPNVLWPPNHKMVPVSLSVSVTDICGETPTCEIISVSSNEPVNGPGDGNTAPDWEVIGPLTLNLRSERSGNGNGRAYTIVVECSDDSGNSATRSTEVRVPHDRR